MAHFLRAAALKDYADVARSQGLDPQHMLHAAGIDPRILSEPDNRLPTAAASDLLERSARSAGCPTFGLQMAEGRQLADLGAASLLLAHQPTLHHALRVLIEFRHLVNESLALDIEDAGDIVVLREAILVEGHQHPRQATDMAIAVLFKACESLLEGGWRPSSVHFSYAAPADLQVHRRIFRARYGTHLQFDSDFDGIVCPRSLIDRPIPSADPAMGHYSRQFVESIPSVSGGSTLLEVRKAIYLLLPSGHATIERVARALHVPVRTLQRRLEEDGTTFRDVLDGVRRDLAVRYLANPDISTTRIAGLLGYSTPASFTRWFKATYEIPPSKYRKAGARVE